MKTIFFILTVCLCFACNETTASGDSVDDVILKDSVCYSNMEFWNLLDSCGECAHKSNLKSYTCTPLYFKDSVTYTDTATYIIIDSEEERPSYLICEPLTEQQLMIDGFDNCTKKYTYKDLN